MTLVGLLVAIAVAAGVTALLRSRDGGSASAGAVGEGSPAPAEEAPPELFAPEDLGAKARPFEVVITWAAPPSTSDALDFAVLRDGSSVGLVTAPGTRFVDDEVEPGQKYTYEVVAQGPAGSASDPSSVRVTTPTPPLATARVEGTYNVVAKVTSKTGIGEYGPRVTFAWRFRPKCKEGACDIDWRDRNQGAIGAKLEQRKLVYEGSYRGRFTIQCGSTPSTSSVTLSLKVVEADAVRGDWRATLLEGTVRHSEAAQLGCRSSSATLDVTAKLIR